MKCIYFYVRLIVLFLVSVPEISHQQNNPTAGSSGCAGQEFCPASQACIRGKCTDPCDGLCGRNTYCTVHSHIPTCTCNKGFSGNPVLGCSKDEQCKDHDQCPASQACVKGKCTDPCEGRCGGNTICTVHSHFPGCTCKSGYNGDPISGCSKQETCRAMTGNAILTHGKKRFYESSEKTNWMKALAGCARNNTRLACVESMEEIKEIDELTEHHAAWTSGTDQGNKFNFFWASTGKPLPTNSELWIKLPIQQPDNYGGDEDCVVFQASLYDDSIYNPGLNDRPCDDEQIYVCEYYE